MRFGMCSASKNVPTAGLNVLFKPEDSDKFDITQMPVTDAVAVVGGTKVEAADYILRNFDKGYLSDKYRDLLAPGSSFRTYLAGRYPEVSDRGPMDWGYVIATSTEDDPSHDFVKYATAHEQLGCSSLSELVALSIFHGMGHNSGVYHGYNGQDIGFMQSPVEGLGNYIRSSGGIVSSVTRTKNDHPEILKLFLIRFK